MLRRLMMAISTALTEIAPASQHYTTATTISVFDRQPTGDALSFDDNFSSTAGLTVIDSHGSYSASGGVLTVTASGGAIQFVEGSALQVPQQFVSVTVSQKPTSGSIRVGIGKDANNYVCSFFNWSNGISSILTVNAGASTFSSGSATISLSGLAVPFKLGFGIVGTRCIAYIDRLLGSGWEAVEFQNIISSYDLTTPSNLSGFKPLFGTSSTAAVKFTNFRAGVHGCDKIRDFGLVTNPDGSPYITGGEAFFSATATAKSPASYMGVFAINLTTYAVRQVAAIMFERGGLTRQDIAGCIVRNSSSSYDVWCATWGNGMGSGGTIQVQWGNTTDDILSGGSFKVSGMVQPSLPGLLNGDSGCYDPCIWFDGTTYTLAYTLVDTTTFSGSPFYPAIATSSDRVTWTLVGKDSSRKGFEGSRLLKTNSDTWLLCGGPTTMHIYDSLMNYIGLLDGAVNGGGATQPWPVVFAYGSNFVMLTFDSTKNSSGESFSWGNLIVKTASRY